MSLAEDQRLRRGSAADPSWRSAGAPHTFAILIPKLKGFKESAAGSRSVRRSPGVCLFGVLEAPRSRPAGQMVPTMGL